MPYHIMYVNLKEGATEEDLISSLSRYEAICKKKVKGWGGFTVYKHYYLGEARRQYQIWLKIEDFATIDGEIPIKDDPEVKDVHDRLISTMDLVNHIDECVSVIYPKREKPFKIY